MKEDLPGIEKRAKDVLYINYVREEGYYIINERDKDDCFCANLGTFPPLDLDM